MKLLLIIAIVLIILLIFLKLIKLLAGITDFFHKLYTKIMPPIKRILIFEYKLFRVVFRNIIYSQEELYPSLRDSSFVGVVYNVKLPKIKTNSILNSIFLISIQLLILGFIIDKSYIEGNLMELKNTLISILSGLLLAIWYFIFKKNKVKPDSNIFLKSTLGPIIEPIKVNLITNMQINALLTTGNYKTTEEINYSLKAKNSSYPLLNRYFMELSGNKSKTKVLNAFIEIFSYLYENREVKASMVELGHGGATVLNHSLHVAEYGLSLFSNDVYGKYEEQVKDRVVFTCLGHDLGKIRCYNENRSNYNGHEQLSYFILGQLYHFSCIDSDIRDDVLHLVNNQSKTFVDESEVLVVTNHMFKTADTKASELEGMQMPEEKILSIYRIAFYDLLRDRDSIARCASLVDGFIYISVNDFVKEIIKITKQTFTVENYANTGIFKHISKLFMLDGLYARGFENSLCHIVFLDKSTNKEIKRYTQCIILKYDVVLDNDNIKSDVIVGLQAKDSIAKLMIKNGQLTFDSSIKNTQLEKIDTPDVEPVKETPKFLDDPEPVNNPEVDSRKSDENLEINSNSVVPETVASITSVVKEKHNHYKKLSLIELENIYLSKLRGVGFIVDRIEFETKSFVRCPVHGKNFPAGSYKAFVKGVPNLHYIVYKTKTFESGHDNIEFKGNYKVTGYSYDGLLQEYDDRVKQEEFRVNDLQEKLATLRQLLSDNGDNKVFSIININEKLIKEVFQEKCFREDVFTVMVQNFETNKEHGYIQLKEINDDVVELANDRLIKHDANYILISKVKEIPNLHSLILVDNLADGLFIYNHLEIPVIVYFDLEITINKIFEIVTIPLIIATNFIDFEYDLSMARKHNCQIINPFGLFESSHKDLITANYSNDCPLNFYRSAWAYKSEVKRYSDELIKQLEMNQLESITNADRVFNYYKDKFNIT